MSEILWAPWRMSYIAAPKPDGCVFCDAAAGTDDRHNLVLARRDDCFVIMNRYPYTHAHIMVVPRAHVSLIEDLAPEAQRCFMDLFLAAQSALRKALNPQGINVGMNIGKAAGAGIESHIHMHIVPRWEGDTNFMPMIGNTRTMPQHIDETYETLLPHFAQIG